MKAVVLTAGLATRLKPVTSCMGKVLIPVYNKPMIFYAVSMIIESGINDILFVCNDFDIPFFKRLFENKYSDYGINIQFTIQKQALGTVDAFRLAQEFYNNDEILLVFGDNLFLSKNVPTLIKEAYENLTGVTIFAKNVNNPKSFGVIETDKNNNIIDIVEKPEFPKSDLAVTGLMLYRSDVFEKIAKVTPSSRGEYEITDLNKIYLNENRAKVAVLPNDCKWIDTGTHDSLLEASIEIKNFEKENGLFGCPEVALFKTNKISKPDLLALISVYNKEYQQKIIDATQLF